MCARLAAFGGLKNTHAKKLAPAEYKAAARVLRHGQSAQGCKTDSLLAMSSAEKHARLRKEYSMVFTSKNMDKVLARLTAEVARSCDAVTAAATAAGGEARVDMLQVGNDLIDSIVQHVCFACLVVPKSI